MALEPSASDRPAMSRVKVAVCVQPLDAAEGDIAASDSSRPSASGCAVQALGSGRLAVSDASTWNTEEFAFDHVYGAFERTKGGVDMSADAAAHRHTRARLFADVGVPALDAAWRGHNVGVFAVGHSGAGARHAMRGDDAIPQTADASRAANGLLPRFVDALFARVEKEREMASGAVTRVDASFVEVRGDRARDLCAHETGSANIVNTTGPVRVRVDSAEKMHRLLRGALEQAATPGASAEDPEDERNPRDAPPSSKVASKVPVTTHFVARVTLTRFLRGVPAKTLAATRAGALEAARDAPLVSEATLVELCGFERARADDSLRELVEAVSSAANGVEAATKKEKADKREAPLSRLARRCRPGGDAMTWVVAAVSPRDDDADATLATLRFASAFRNVRCLSRRNVDPDAELFAEAESEARAVEGEVERLAKALAAARVRRAEAPAKRASFGRRATFDPAPSAESESEETDRLRMALRDARAARDAVERRRRAARAKWTAKLERYAASGKLPARRGAFFGDVPGVPGVPAAAASETAGGPNGDALDADPPPRSSAPATLTHLFRAHAVTRGNESDPPPPRTIAVPAEPGGRVRVGADRDCVDVAIAGFGVRPTHAVVLRDEAFPDAVVVAAADGDPDADVWVNGARVPSLEDARAAGAPPARLQDGDRVVVGARSGAAYVFRDPNGECSNRSTTSAGVNGATDDATADRDGVIDDAKQTRGATLDPWLEARLELKPLAATLARALAGAPSPPLLDPGNLGDVSETSPRFQFQNRERRRRWREGSRANLARVLPDVDEFNARCRAMGVQARVAPAWDAAPSASAAGADGASVSVVARLTRGLSARAVVELEASAIDDVTNVAATWSAADFLEKRLRKLRAFFLVKNRAGTRDVGPELGSASLSLGPSPSWEEDEEDPFLTFDPRDGSVALRFADVAPGATGGRDVSASRPRTPASEARGSRPASATKSFSGTRGGKRNDTLDDTLDDTIGSETDGDSRVIVAPEVTSAATAERSAANAKEARKKTRDEENANDSPEPSPRTVSDPETTADRLFRALAAERATIASLERRLDDAEGKARAAHVAATRAETLRAAAEERSLNATRAAEARAAEASARAADFEARLDAETRLAQTKDMVSQNTIEALRATIATLESDLELTRLPAKAETHLDVPGLGPFAFPLVPLALEKAVPGENAKKTAEKLRELIRDFRRAAAAADVTLEYSKGLVDRVRAECALARADKADEIARRVAIEYALEAKNAAVASLGARLVKAERLMKAEKTNGAAATVSPARAVAEPSRTAFGGNPNGSGTVTSENTDPSPEKENTRARGILGIRPRESLVPPLNLSAAAKFADDAENAAPDWAKRATPLLRMLPRDTRREHAAEHAEDTRSPAQAPDAAKEERAVTIPAALRELTDLAMSLPLSARRSESPAPPSPPANSGTPPRRELRTPPRGEVASRVKAKLGGRERLQSRGDSAASAGNSPNPPSPPGPRPDMLASAFSPPRGGAPGAPGVDVADVAALPRGDGEGVGVSPHSPLTRPRFAGSLPLSSSPSLPLSRPRPRATREWWETDLAGNDTTTPSPSRRGVAPPSANALPVPVPVPGPWRSPAGEVIRTGGGVPATPEDVDAEQAENLGPRGGGDGETLSSDRKKTRLKNGIEGETRVRARPFSPRLRPPATPEDVGAFGAVSQEERRAWWAKRQLRGAVAKIGAVRAFKQAGARRERD